MERQARRRDRVVAQNYSVVCKVKRVAVPKELLLPHIAVEQIPAVRDARPITRCLCAAGISHVDGHAAGLTFLPGLAQNQPLLFDAFPILVVGGMEDKALHRSNDRGSPRVEGAAVSDTLECPWVADKLMYQSMLGISS